MGRKLKFILSDLHIGAGRVQGCDNYLEDFTADERLVHFLHEVRQESDRDRREVELIINGDLFEFLQVPGVDNYNPQEMYPREAYLDSSERASVKRLDTIIEGHTEVFDAFSDFMHVETPQRRITIIKGNHDVNLFWSGVKSRLREVLGASGSRSSLLLFAEEFVSREKIYVEHGHQRTEKMNSYHDFLDPRLPSDLTQLYYPAGSHFVIDFFNNWERERWFVDSIKPVTTLIWYAFHWDFNFAAKMLACFIRYTPALVVSDFVPNDEFRLSMPALLQDLEDEDKCNQLAQLYQADPVFRQQFHQQVYQYLSDANIINKGPTPLPPPSLDHDPLVIGRADQEQQQLALRQAAEEIARQEGAKVILFGHTHRPVQESLEAGGIYINTGCWMKDFSDALPEVWATLFNGSRRHEGLPQRLPYARIDYDEYNHPVAKLLDFADKDTTLHATHKPGGFFEKNLNRLVRLFGHEGVS